MDLRDLTVNSKKKEKDAEKSLYILTNEGEAVSLVKATDAVI